MATKSLARSEMNKIELRVLEQVLYSTADIIDALMKDGLPYTKIMAAPPTTAEGGLNG